MELSTIKIKNPNYIVPIFSTKINASDDWIKSNNRLSLIFVNSGAGILKLNDHKRVFNAPCVICLNETEEFTLDDGKNFSAQVIYFHPGFINSVFTFDNIREKNSQLEESDIRDLNWLDSFTKRNDTFIGLLNLGPATAKHVHNLFESIDYQLKEQPGKGYWPCRSRSYLLELLFLLERLYQMPETIDELILDRVPDDINRIILYLHNNYTEKITLGYLCDFFHINRTTLNDKFIEATGTPVMTYLIKLRIKLAALMLKDTMLSISEIIERIGFGDISHFGRMFRKYMGCSPSDYRKQFCWMKE